MNLICMFHEYGDDSCIDNGLNWRIPFDAQELSDSNDAIMLFYGVRVMEALKQRQ